MVQLNDIWDIRQYHTHAMCGWDVLGKYTICRYTYLNKTSGMYIVRSGAVCLYIRIISNNWWLASNKTHLVFVQVICFKRFKRDRIIWRLLLKSNIYADTRNFNNCIVICVLTIYVEFLCPNLWMLVYCRHKITHNALIICTYITREDYLYMLVCLRFEIICIAYLYSYQSVTPYHMCALYAVW